VNSNVIPNRYVRLDCLSVVKIRQVKMADFVDKSEEAIGDDTRKEWEKTSSVIES
jgi:hypothetical protein